MKKIIFVVIALFVLANAGLVAYRLGWLARLGLGPATPPTSADAAALPRETPGAVAPSAASPAAPSMPASPNGEAASAPAAPAGGMTATPGSQAAAAQAAPAFDGDVSSLNWGGAVESVTGSPAASQYAIDVIDDNKNGGMTWGNTFEKTPKEFVVSFYEHELVLVDHVVIDFLGQDAKADVEVWTSMTSATDGFSKVAEASLEKGPGGTVRFAPVEAKFVKTRLLRNGGGYASFPFKGMHVFEAQRQGYTPLLARHPELTYWPSPAGAAGPSSPVVPPVAACAPPVENPPASGRSESRRVLILTENDKPGGDTLQSLLDDKVRQIGPTNLSILDRAEFTYKMARLARAWLLGPKYGFDTVVMSCVCERARPMSASFKRALVAWVGEGHKLIVRDSDHCTRPGPDLTWLPYPLKTNNPGNLGAKGTDLRFVEENWMAHARPRREGFVDVTAWVADPANELGDSNTVFEWDPHWCGQLAVRNAKGVFGFSQTYAHYGLGLIIYDGFDRDNVRIPSHRVLLARQLVQGFNPDNLVCSTPMGDFIITSAPDAPRPALVIGQDLRLPLAVLSNQGYKGRVTLSSAATPAVSGLTATFNPPVVDVAGEAGSTLTMTVPAGTPVRPMGIAVTGVDAHGVSNTACIGLVPPREGELAVVSALPHPSKSRKNLEIILDASGSMKTMLGKKSRWDTALETLEQVLTKLPDDFNVGLRMYGHREASTSPRTCTDSQLVVPIRKLDRAAILRQASSFKPKGETPLVYSALQAPSDLKAAGGGTVILITDGEESCKGDPVQAAATLKASGLDIALNIVGFTVTGQKVQRDLTAFAQSTGGQFYAAQSGEALADALLVAAVDRFPYIVLDASGKQVAAGEAGGPAEELPPGDYKVVINIGAQPMTATVRVEPGKRQTVQVVARNDRLVLEPLAK
jgi:hypothetical protein